MEKQQTVLIVEDEKNIVDILRFNLQKEGYATLEAFDGVTGLRLALDENPDLILLDLMLPEMNGFEVCKLLRDKGRSTPVLIITAREEEKDKILGLDLGADDYLVKPFGVMEMVSRVKAVLRRCKPREAVHILTDGGLSLDLDQRTVTADGERVQLTYKEFELLRLFLSHPGMAFSREQLFTQVWNMTYMDDSRTLDMHIRTLRQKLGDYGKQVETVRNVGYRWEQKA